MIKSSNETNLMVSVVMITYCHEDYLANAIEGILSQEIDFPIELIIADDCSPDNTKQIVKNICQNHINGNFIKYTRHSENMGMSENFIWAMSEAKGKYIALCEGDDIWTDSNKLKKQIEFLEKNLDYGLVCGGFSSINHINGQKTDWLKSYVDENSKFNFGFDINIERFWKSWCIQTLTVVFRKSLLNIDQLLIYKKVIDMHVFHHIIKQKKGFYFKEILGIQNITIVGVYSNKRTIEKRKMLYFARKEIFINNKSDKVLKGMFFSVSSELFVNNKFIKGDKHLKRYILFFDMVKSAQKLNDFKHIVICILRPKVIRNLFLNNE